MRKLLFALILLGGGIHQAISGSIQNPKIRWKFKTQGSMRGTAITDQAQIYFGSADGFFYALNKSTGELKWKFETQGAISATPALHSSMVIFTSRDNFVYALNANNGTLIWKFQMQALAGGYWEWEYFTSTPVPVDNRVYVGSGDGHLYALSLKDGKQLWKFKTNGRVRATPLVVDKTIYQPSNDGIVYALNSDGKLLWQFETDGSKIDSYKVGFDRTNIFAKPLLADSLLIIAARDGKTYGVDIYSHKERWRFTYGSTWAMTTSVKSETVFVGWSTNNLLCALDIKTGKEKWKFKAGGVVYSTPLIWDNDILIGSGDEKIYSINKTNGQKNWEYKAGGKVNSSVIRDGEILYFGCDDGSLYALEEGIKPHKAVYMPVRDPKFDFFIVDPKISPYLKDGGFQQLDSARLYQFLKDRINDKAPSVIVFAYDMIPPNMVGEDPAKGMIRAYLETGGKILWFGNTPNLYSFDSKGKPTQNISTPNQLLDVEFVRTEESGNYYNKTTQEGLNWGLPSWFMATYATISPKGIIPLSYDENKRVGAWLKKFNPRPGSGFISCRSWAWYAPMHDSDFQLIYDLAMYGLE